jgi:metal-responsive CopG/Arc/MetJ family transcriptional regulator
MRTIVDLPSEHIKRLALLCRREKISRAEAVRRAVEQLLRSATTHDLKDYFGASKTRGNIARRLLKLRKEWNQAKLEGAHR